jgi:hypothetical protein
VLLPSDFDTREDIFAFSSFALLLRNSPFGRKVLENWREFGMGLCPNGNWPHDKEKYEWYHADQTGLWYALMKTHMHFYPNDTTKIVWYNAITRLDTLMVAFIWISICIF